MQPEQRLRLQVDVKLTDKGEAPPLQAYAFTNQGKLLGTAPVEKGSATVEVPAELNGRTVELILGPRIEKDQPAPTAASLKRMGAYTRQARVLQERPRLSLEIPSIIFPSWCVCHVRGRLVKRRTLPDGTTDERPVCNARVHICEVDRIPLVITRLPEYEIIRLRDELLDRLRIIPERIIPRPWPGPDPSPLRGLNPTFEAASSPMTRARHAHAAAAELSAVPQLRTASAKMRSTADSPGAASLLNGAQQQSVAALASTDSVAQARTHLSSLASLISIHLCALDWLWGYFRTDCLNPVMVDANGQFHALLFHDCSDQPDIYIWVEQFQDGAWTTVYRPGIGCGTRWNYACGTEIVINIPGADACEEPGYDVPSGVTLFVLPWAIASSPIWGKPAGAPPAPTGWVRPDGYIDYHTPGLGLLHDAPFGGTLNFIHDDSYFIPSAGIKYYRYSYRRVGTANWTPISTPLNRIYRMEYSGPGQLPTYESYPVGPFTVGAQTSLFEFKPKVPPARPTDPPTVVVREWGHGNLGEVAASWNTVAAAPPLSTDNASDDAGDFDVKIEVFDPAGVQVMPGAATFRFLVRNADGTTTRLATPAEEAAGAYVLRVHVDNNHVQSDLPQPSIGGVAASDDCGFLRYETGDSVLVRYLAAHPNNHAVFGFGIKRGSNWLATASTTAPYVEVSAASAPTGSLTPYSKVGGYYQRDFAPAELVGTCVNAAFAASLGVYGKAMNGDHRLGLDASELIAFALAEVEPDE